MEAKDRTKAYRIRAKERQGQPLDDDERDWIGEYEAAQAKNTASLGASNNARKVSFELEETAQAVGVGDPAVAAAAAGASLAREEGRRLDYLTNTAITALTRACELHEKMAASLLERTRALEEVHLSMLDAVREQYLARTQAEIDAMQAESANDEKPDDDPVNKLLAEVATPFLAGAAKHMNGQKAKKTAT